MQELSPTSWPSTTRTPKTRTPAMPSRVYSVPVPGPNHADEDPLRRPSNAPPAAVVERQRLDDGSQRPRLGSDQP